MLSHYLRTALRNLARHRMYTAINVTGLSVAVTFAVLALLFARRELTMDAFHERVDRLYRVYHVQGEPAEHRFTAFTSGPLGPAMRAEVPGITGATRVRNGARQVRRSDGDEAARLRVTFVDPDFLRMFSFPLAQGDRDSALDDPFRVVLDAPTSRRLFGDADPVGETVRIYLSDEYAEFTVTGVLAPVRDPTDFALGILIPFSTPGTDHFDDLESWRTFFTFTYVELSPEQSPEAITASLGAMARHLKGVRDHSIDLALQPMSETYLDESIEGGQTSPVFAYVFAGAAVAVLLIACINFTNLSIGLSGTRVLEVAVRKASGAGRGRVMAQFWTESILLCAGAVILGAGMAELFLPSFNQLLYEPLTFHLQPDVVIGLVAMVLVTGVLAGGYPSLVLSRLAPALVARSAPRIGGMGWFSRCLVGFQFTVSIALLIVLFVMTAQVDFVTRKDLGFPGDQVLSIWTHADSDDPESSRALVERFRAEAAQIPGVRGVSVSAVSATSTRRTDILGEHHHILPVGHRYIETLGLRLVAGRSFAPDLASDVRGATIINETAARHFRLRIGDRIEGYGDEPVVVGIVEDYHFQPVYTTIKPQFFFRGDPYAMRFLIVGIDTEDALETVESLRAAWHRVAPDLTLELGFADDEYAATFEELAQFARFVGWAAALAIGLAAMGVFGLASLAVARRTKEVGVRKVLGATVASVVRLFNREVTWLVVVAGVVACPLAWLAADTFLADFPYRIDVGPGYFVAALLLILVLAWATVSAQALRAALSNPVDALRYE